MKTVIRNHLQALLLGLTALNTGCDNGPRILPLETNPREPQTVQREAWRDFQSRGHLNPDKANPQAGSTRVPLDPKYAILMDKELDYARSVNLVSEAAYKELKTMLASYEKRDAVWESIDWLFKYNTDLEKIKGRVIQEIKVCLEYDCVKNLEDAQKDLKCLADPNINQSITEELDDKYSRLLMQKSTNCSADLWSTQLHLSRQATSANQESTKELVSKSDKE